MKSNIKSIIRNVEARKRIPRLVGKEWSNAQLYLVGSLERWNDAKFEEQKARVKHSLPTSGQYTPEEKTAIEVLKLENSVMSQI